MTKNNHILDKTPDYSPQIRVVMHPKDTNSLGNIFGGVILSYIDLAASEHSKTVAPHLYVTKAVKEVDFISPVFVGDKVSCYTETKKIGKTSITVKVLVSAERGMGRDKIFKVTEAEVVMVAIDKNGKTVNITSQ